MEGIIYIYSTHILVEEKIHCFAEKWLMAHGRGQSSPLASSAVAPRLLQQQDSRTPTRGESGRRASLSGGGKAIPAQLLRAAREAEDEFIASIGR